MLTPTNTVPKIPVQPIVGYLAKSCSSVLRVSIHKNFPFIKVSYHVNFVTVSNDVCMHGGYVEMQTDVVI